MLTINLTTVVYLLPLLPHSFTAKIVHLKVTDYWELNNPNYYPIQLVSFNVQAYHEKLLTETNNSTSKMSVCVSACAKVLMFEDENLSS